MGNTISKKFSILVENEVMLKELNLDKNVSQITADVDYFYRSPERFEACAELDISITKIEIEVDTCKSFDCEQYCSYFGLDEDEFTDELKSNLESEIRSLDINKIEDGEEVELKSAEDVLAEYKTDISIPQIQNTFKQYSEEFAKICGVSSIESIAGTVYEKLFLLSLKNISKIEQKPSPAVDARDLFSQIEKLAIEAGVVESKGKMFLGFFKSGGAKQKDVLLHLNGVDSGDNGCYYIDTEEFQDENNESELKELVAKAGKFGISRIEIY